jgi:type IV pilus assembly protein PilX
MMTLSSHSANFVVSSARVPFRRRGGAVRSAARERGMIMVVALIFLMLLTILAISASGNSLLQERMSGGLRNAQQAQMSAETALRAAEWKLWKSGGDGGESLHCGTAVPGDCYAFDPTSPIDAVSKFRSPLLWTTVGATVYQGVDGASDYTSLANGRLAQNPLYLIEDLGPERPPGVVGGLHESGATGPGGAGYRSTGRHLYRITARASGGTVNTTRLLETTFSARGN